MAIEDIKNFLSVGELLGTGGQPTESQLAEVARAGYRAVVNLGLLDQRYCLPDEAGVVARLGMDYHQIPVKFDEPKFADFERFTELMTSFSAQRTFVHCAANLRVSAVGRQAHGARDRRFRQGDGASESPGSWGQGRG